MSEISDMSTISDMFRELPRVGSPLTGYVTTEGRAMPLMRRLTALAGTAAAARTYVRRNPDKVNKIAAKAGQFVDKRTKGKYHSQIGGAVRKVKDATGRA